MNQHHKMIMKSQKNDQSKGHRAKIFCDLFDTNLPEKGEMP